MILGIIINKKDGSNDKQKNVAENFANIIMMQFIFLNSV